MPNKLSQIWQELRCRNVTRVLAVYIAVAFMLLELVDMISEPFGLPEWFMKVGFFILLAGLIITLIVSWIYTAYLCRVGLCYTCREKVCLRVYLEKTD